MHIEGETLGEVVEFEGKNGSHGFIPDHLLLLPRLPWCTVHCSLSCYLNNLLLPLLQPQVLSHGQMAGEETAGTYRAFMG